MESAVRPVATDRSEYAARSESLIGSIRSFRAFPNVERVTILHKPSGICPRVPQMFTSAELKSERSMLGDRSKRPVESAHFRMQRARSDQTPTTFRSAFERFFQRLDRSDRTGRCFRTHPEYKAFIIAPHADNMRSVEKFCED